MIKADEKMQFEYVVFKSSSYYFDYAMIEFVYTDCVVWTDYIAEGNVTTLKALVLGIYLYYLEMKACVFLSLWIVCLFSSNFGITMIGTASHI